MSMRSTSLAVPLTWLRLLLLRPFTGDREAPSSSLTSSLEADRVSSPDAEPTPHQADEFVYRLDDGSTETALGAAGGDFMWINAFETVEEATTIDAISSAWANVSEDREAEFFLYDDPNNDGNPEDAVLLESVSTSIQAPESDEFTVGEITPTDVEGVFFIAAIVRGYVDGEFPAPLDESGSQQASWTVFGQHRR